MKIAYIADIRLPTEKAHGLQVMETCAAMKRAGLDVTLFISSRASKKEEVIFSYYGINDRFNIVKVPSLNIIRLGPIGFLLQSRYFAWQVSKLLKQEKFDIVYTRDESTSFVLPDKDFRVVYEMHDVRKNSLQQRNSLQKLAGIVAITKGVADYCISQGFNNNKIVIAADGANISRFDIDEDKMLCRQRLGLPVDKKIALYSGHLYLWKGADVLANVSDTNVLKVFVGGSEPDLSRFKSMYGNRADVIILGQKPHGLIPTYLRSADVLVLPNSAKEDISRLYTSPLKLFEYMASGTPIVASDLPSIKEVLNDSNAVFFKADDSLSLSEKINMVLADTELAQRVSAQAKLDVQNFTWDRRAGKIMNFLKTI